MKKRLFSMVLAVALLVSTMTMLTISANAACEATVTVGSVSGVKGDVVEVPVSISAASCMVNADFHLTFDTTKLELDKTYYADPEGDEGDATFYQVNTKLFPSSWMYSANEKTPGDVVFLVATGSNTGLTNGGEMIRLAFRILTDNVEDIAITLTADPIIGNDGSGDVDEYGYPKDTAIDLTVVNGKISVGSVTTTTQPKPALLGDVNGDNKVNMIDAMVIYSAVSKGAVKPEQIPLADMDGNGKLNMIDAMRIYAIASGKA